MAVVLVTGGTGALGQLVVASLREQGDEVRVLSRRRGAGTHVGDLATGAGAADAARGAELVVHAASDTPFGRTDVEQTAHLIDVARRARHLLYLSIVGIDKIPFPYYQRKLKCEQLVASSGIPSTILRATQFHELIAFLAHGAERLPIAPLPLDFRFQTMAAADVAERVVELVGRPARGTRPRLRRPRGAQPPPDGRHVAGRARTSGQGGAAAGAGQGPAGIPRRQKHVSRPSCWPPDLGRVRRLRGTQSLQGQRRPDAPQARVALRSPAVGWPHVDIHTCMYHTSLHE